MWDVYKELLHRNYVTLVMYEMSVISTFWYHHMTIFNIEYVIIFTIVVEKNILNSLLFYVIKWMDGHPRP
jgi:hypothetical protein